ncbi:MAG TPA: ABC transporter ATP-binding protein [Verrucomicrobiae bacterium]|jgi:ABC-type multidrug transport system fused ATPase/permease subunit|nr:ABC transporter ATP-binding protein [Verrucomicrobiae bacterium]
MTAHRQFNSDSDPTLHASSRSTWEVVRRVARYLRPYKFMAIANIGCALISLAFSLAFPQLAQVIIDDVTHGGRSNYLWPAAGLLAAFLFRDLFNSLRILVNNVFEQNVIFDIRRDVFARLQRLPIGYFDQRASGDLMTRVIDDVNAVERVLIDGTEQGTVASLSVIVVVAVLFYKNPTLAAITLTPIPLLTAGTLWYTLTAHRRYRAQRRAASAMSAFLMDSLQGVRQIKAFGRQKHEDERFAHRADELRNSTLGVMKVWAIYSPAMTFSASLGTALVLWKGGSLVASHKLTVGELVGFILYLALFYEPLGRLHGLNQMLQSARAAGERVFDILDATEERGAIPGRRQCVLELPVRGAVRYENVQFGYGKDRTALKNISLRAAPGEMIALVGPTGAGKSTLVNLLPAFYEATSGTITIDGQDTATLSLESLRSQISVVSQEAFLFNGTVRENILYGRLDASEEELMAASRAANCHDFIVHLPGGYDSRVGERGVKLSVGEKQRVSIARALLKNAPILILDEATASVDTATEKLIQEALERLMAHRTSFVIAHRLSTIANADQILVLCHGEIVESGTRQELLDLNGLYAKLSRIQNTTFIEESFEKISVGE